MALTPKILYRENLVSAGRDSSGAPVQGKQKVVGQLTGDYAAGAESFSARDFGLSNIDAVFFNVSNDSTATTQNMVSYNFTNGDLRIIVVSDTGSGVTDLSELSDGTTTTVYFEAIGDSALAVDQVV